MFTLSTPLEKRPYHHGDLRQALVRAALEILSEAGVGGLSLRAAARRARVSAMAPYRHFADKEALLAAVAEYGLRELAAQLIAAPATAADPRAGSAALGVAYVLFACDQPSLFKLMFVPMIEKKTRASGLGRSGQCLFQRPSAGRRGGKILRWRYRCERCFLGMLVPRPWPLGTDRRWQAGRTRHWSGRGSRDAADPLTERQSRRAQTQATPLEPEGARPPEKTERLSRLISSANDGSRVLISYSTHKARCAREAHRRMPSDDSLQKPSPARRRSAPTSVQCLPISPDRDRPDDQGEGGDRPQFGKRAARIGEVRL